jgi:hypothetical protein
MVVLYFPSSFPIISPFWVVKWEKDLFDKWNTRRIQLIHFVLLLLYKKHLNVEDTTPKRCSDLWQTTAFCFSEKKHIAFV